MDNETEISVKLWSKVIERVIHDESVLTKITMCTVMAVILVVSVIGNTLTCIVIYYDKSMHTITNYYLFNLAISDLLVSLAAPLYVHEQLDSGNYMKFMPFGELACKIHFFFVSVMWNSGTLTMTVLSVERYVGICHPMKFSSSLVMRRVAKNIAVIWIVAIIETTADICSVYLIKTDTSSICLIAPTRFAKIVNLVLALITFLIPLGIMTFVYSMIAFKVKHNQNNVGTGTTFNKRNNISKVNKLVMALTAALFVCWVPFFVSRLCISAWDVERLMRVDILEVTIWRFSIINSWFSSVLNPVLFSLMSSKFRCSLKALCRRRNLTPDRTTRFSDYNQRVQI